MALQFWINAQSPNPVCNDPKYTPSPNFQHRAFTEIAVFQTSIDCFLKACSRCYQSDDRNPRPTRSVPPSAPFCARAHCFISSCIHTALQYFYEMKLQSIAPNRLCPNISANLSISICHYPIATSHPCVCFVGHPYRHLVPFQNCAMLTVITQLSNK